MNESNTVSALNCLVRHLTKITKDGCTSSEREFAEGKISLLVDRIVEDDKEIGERAKFHGSSPFFWNEGGFVHGSTDVLERTPSEEKEPEPIDRPMTDEEWKQACVKKPEAEAGDAVDELIDSIDSMGYPEEDPAPKAKPVPPRTRKHLINQPANLKEAEQ